MKVGRSAGVVLAAVLLAMALMGNSQSTTSAQQTRPRAWLVSPMEGEIVQGPDVTFRVESSGVRLPEEHFHLLVDGAVLRHVPGTAIPLAQVDMVHFRAKTTTIRLSPGPHVVVLIATNNDHVPLTPWAGQSRYFVVR